MQPDRFNNRKYGNWVKNSLSLLYLKEGITKFSDEKAGEFHKDVAERVRLRRAGTASTKCTRCTYKSAVKTKTPDKTNTTWRMNCNSNICNVWLEEVLPYHAHLPLPNIAWANSNPQLWQSDVWELAKLFQPYGCENHSKAEDSDCTALLTMMLDCKFFHTFLTNTTRLREIKEVRNACMHSRDQEIDDLEITRALNLMVALLEEPSLKNRTECITAKSKILQLRDNALELSLNKDLEIRALNNRVAEVRTDIDRVAAEHQQMKTDLNDITDRQDSTVEECNKLRDRMAQVRLEITEMSKNLQSLQQNHDPSLGGNVDDLTSRLRDLETKSQADYEDVLENVKSTMATVESRLHDIETQKTEEKQQREDILKRTQNALISLYKTTRQKVPFFPLRPEWTGSVKDLYVKQSMSEMNPRGVRLSTEQTCSKNAEAILEEIRDIFYSGEKSCRDIYVVAESGSGKSTLCEFLVYLWVKKYSEMENEVEKSEEESFMEDFPLLFYISLREANRNATSNIEDMIRSQLQLSFNDEDMSKLILDYPCLIILDGLDEYSLKHSKSTQITSVSLPWRRHSDTNTVLTTSRPWKMELLSSEVGVKIDRQIRITGLETKSQHDLAKIVITKLNSIKEDENKSFTDFLDDMEEKHLNKYMETPILLLQMLGLWFDGESFGKSQCEIYSKIIEKQIQFAAEVKRIPAASNPDEACNAQTKPKQGGFLHKLSTCHLFGKRHSGEEVHHGAQLPACFKNMRYCQTFHRLLLKLSKLAYRHLFGNQESALIFDHDQMEIMGLSEEDIQSCLYLGLLTQYSVLNKITHRQKSISFVHKSHQEFFAAIYLWQIGLGSELKPLLASFTDLDSALQIEKVFTFVSGMNPDVSREIAKVIMAQASKDVRIKQYRDTSLLNNAPNQELVLQIQGMIITAIEESRNNERTMPAILLQDIYMEGGHRDFPPARIFECTQFLQLNHLRSIFIDKPVGISPDEIRRLVNSSSQLNKIVLSDCDISASSVMEAVKRNRDSLQALGLFYRHIDALDCCRLSQKDLAKILSPSSLGLHNIILSHEQLELMYTHLGQRTYTEVKLADLRCQRHGFKDCKSRLDLSASTELRRLALANLPIQDVEFRPDSLLWYFIGELPYTMTIQALHCLTEARNLEQFYCQNMTQTAVVDLVRILPQLKSLTLINLYNLDLRDQQRIDLHNMNTLEKLYLYRITLTATQFRQLLRDLPSRTVYVALGRSECDFTVTITDCDSSDDIITQIASSPDTEVITHPEVTYEDDKWLVKWFTFDYKK